MLVKLKNVILEWSSYLITIFRLFRRSSSSSKKKNAVIEKENLVVNIVATSTTTTTTACRSAIIGDNCDNNRSNSGCSSVADCGSSKNCCSKQHRGEQHTGNTLAAKNSSENSFKTTARTETSKKSSKNSNKKDVFKSTKCSCKSSTTTSRNDNKFNGNLERNNISNSSNHPDHEQLNQLDSYGGGGGSSSNISVCEAIANEDFEKITIAPSGVDEKEWIASHLLAFFHHINALYGSVSEFCIPENCPVMNGKDTPQILWIDERGRKCKYSAQQYIDCVMSFVEKIVDSEEAFPTKFGTFFPTNFDQSAKKIFRLLYNVLNHLNTVHFAHLKSINLHHQVRTLTVHFVLFCKRYDDSLDYSKTLLHHHLFLLNNNDNNSNQTTTSTTTTAEQDFINLSSTYYHNNNKDNLTLNNLITVTKTKNR